MKRIIHFKEQCHPHLATEIHFSLGGFCLSKKFLMCFFFVFFLGFGCFFSFNFCCFSFCFSKAGYREWTKRGWKQYCSSPFAYRIKSKALSQFLSVFYTCRPWLTLGKPDWASPITQWVKNSPAMQETQEMWVWSLGQEDPLEKEMATRSSILAWKNSVDRGVWQAIVRRAANIGYN